MNETIAIIGGRFDPFHLGHFKIINSAQKALHIDRSIVVPNGTPAHKNVHATMQHRLQMCKLGCVDIAKCEVSDIEDQDQACYTFDMVQKLMPKYGTIILILGGDAFMQIHTWHKWRELLAMVNWAIVPRKPDNNWLPVDEEARKIVFDNIVYSNKQLVDSEAKVWMWGINVEECASSIIRPMISLKNDSWKKMLAPSVADYICEHKIYQ